MQKIKIGILIDRYEQPVWVRKMFESLQSSNYAEINFIVINDNPVPREAHSPNREGGLESLVFKAIHSFYQKFVAIQKLGNAEAPSDCTDLFSSVETLKVKTKIEESSESFFDEDIKKIKDQDLDILLKVGFGSLKGKIFSSVKHGVWSLQHSDSLIKRGGPAGLWESLEGWPVTGSTLQILTEDPDGGKVLCRSHSCTKYTSVTDNKSNYYWKSILFVNRSLKDLYELGAEEFFKKVDQQNKDPLFYSGRDFKEPTTAEYAKLVCRKFIDRVKTTISSKFFFDQWIIMYHFKKGFSPALWRYKKILPPKDRFWADPYVIKKDGKYYIFIEECPFATYKGFISLITMDEKGNYSQPEVILEKPYHLSYPNVFEFEGDYYMVPESIANKTIELYKATDFPYKWEFQYNLMEGVRAVDATFLKHGDRWWLFANQVEIEGVSDWDELFIYSSDSPISKNWIPHKNNPVISDCRISRPAGNFFEHNGEIYRPSQDCSVRYGRGLNLNRVVHLSEDKYEEELVSKALPDWGKEILGVHTYSRDGDLHLIDAIYRRRR